MYDSTLFKPEFADYALLFWIAFSCVCAYILCVLAKETAEWFADQRWHVEHPSGARMNPLILLVKWGIATMTIWWLVGIPMLENLIPLLVPLTNSGHWQDNAFYSLFWVTWLVSLVLAAISLWFGARRIIPREYPNSRFVNRWLPTLETLGPRRWELERG